MGRKIKYEDIFIKPVFYHKKKKSKAEKLQRHVAIYILQQQKLSSWLLARRGGPGAHSEGALLGPAKTSFSEKELGAPLWCPRDWEMQRHRDKGGPQIYRPGAPRQGPFCVARVVVPLPGWIINLANIADFFFSLFVRV